MKQDYFLLTHMNMFVDMKKMRKDSKFEAARCDQTVRRGAPIRDKVAIYAFNFGYR